MAKESYPASQEVAYNSWFSLYKDSVLWIHFRFY